ncbi:MAG: peptidase U32 family protein [bacterium]
MSTTIPQLIAPAGNFEKLIIALHYGADAVYLGDSRFSLRAMAKNFNEEEVQLAIGYTHKKGAQAYITANIFPHNRDIGLLREYVHCIKELGADGIIISDAGLLCMVKEIAPNLPVHISTQANITNYESALFWEKMGAKRLILARELSLDEIKEIRQKVSLELEIFVHGSICVSYSGRCYISSFLAYKSANRGMCTNSCRWSYTLMEEKRPGQYFPVFEDDRGTYLLSSKDLCLIEYVPEIAKVGITSVKIEGRMKGINYLGGVVKTYREALDSLKNPPYIIKDYWLKELSSFSNRGYTRGKLFGDKDNMSINFDGINYRRSHDFIGQITAVHNDHAEVELRNKLYCGDTIEFLTPGLEDTVWKVTSLGDLDGNIKEFGNTQERVIINVPAHIRRHDLIRRKIQ